MTTICTQDIWPSNHEWLRQFRAKASADRIPVSGMLELTRRCNLRCVHCYQGDDALAGHDADGELNTTQVLGILDEVVDAGCLYFTFTGGDPMLRRDFADIYAHARKKGLVVSILCNGSLVTDPVMEVFDRHPPSCVEITLYGSREATHDAVTGVAGSFEKTWGGIRRIHDAGFRVSLKTVLMTSNVDEISEIRMAARELGMRYRVDPIVFPRFSDRDKQPMDLRVPPETAVAKEMEDEKRVAQWKRYADDRKNLEPSEALYECGAGLTCFFIDAEGKLSPCLMTVGYKYDLLEKGFRRCWDEDMPAILGRKAEAGYPCAGCEIKAACTSCPALHYLENGREDAISEYACRVAKLRYDMLRSVKSEDYAGAPS